LVDAYQKDDFELVCIKSNQKSLIFEQSLVKNASINSSSGLDWFTDLIRKLCKGKEGRGRNMETKMIRTVSSTSSGGGSSSNNGTKKPNSWSVLKGYLLTPLPPNVNNLKFDEREKLRRTRLLQYFYLITAGANIVGVITTLVLLLMGAPFANLVSVVTSTLNIGIMFGGAVLAGKGYYNWAAWLLLGVATGSLTISVIITGYSVPLLLAYIIPLALAIVILDSNRQLVVVSLIILAINTCFCLLTYNLNSLQPTSTNTNTNTSVNSTRTGSTEQLLDISSSSSNQHIVIALIVVFPLLVALVRIPAQSQVNTLRSQNARLEKAFGELEERYRTSSRIGLQVQTLASQLSVTASQQASGSIEQLAVVSQVKSSIVELSSAATSIASLTAEVNQTMGQVALDSRRIEETTSQAVEQTRLGLASVEETVGASIEAATLYQQLLDIMHELSDKNKRMETILNVLGSIASETHLLALNAAIEAAGAGLHGERFAVVAQEVKNLAARSSERSQEVVEIIRAIEGVTVRALVAAESGCAKTQHLELVAGKTGTVIGKLGEIADAAQLQASGISQVTGQARSLTATIQVATRQQHIAGEQVLEAVSGLGTVAKQSAEGSSQVSYSAENLEELSQWLNTGAEAGVGAVGAVAVGAL
jgi:methyl-accepting chemotaxis protein